MPGGTNGDAEKEASTQKRSFQKPVVTNLQALVDDSHGDYMDGRIDDPSDPMGTGISGPTVEVGEKHSATTRRFLVETVGMFRALAEKPTRDVWGKHWTVDTEPEDVADELAAFDRGVRVWPTLRGAHTAFRRAHRLSKRDGLGIVLHEIRDEAPNEEPPSGVETYLHAKVLPEQHLVEIELEDDMSSDRWELPKRVKLAADPEDEGTAEWFHWERVQLFIHDPWDGHREWRGRNVLDANRHNAQGGMNIMWAATEAVFQRVAPYLVGMIEGDVELSDDQWDDFKGSLDELVQGVAQKIAVKGGNVEPLTGSENIVDPQPFMQLHREDAAAGSGIPKRELTGSEAGQLAAAEYDERRYQSSIVQMTQEEFAELLVRDWYDRLMRWGLVPEADILDVRWPPLRSLTDLERAQKIETLGNAASVWESTTGKIPTEIMDLVELEDPSEEEEEEASTPSLTGVQIQSILETLDRFNAGQLPRVNAIGVIQGAVPSLPTTLVEEMVPAEPAGSPASPGPAGPGPDEPEGGGEPSEDVLDQLARWANDEDRVRDRIAQRDTNHALKLWASDEVQELNELFAERLHDVMADLVAQLEEHLQAQTGEQVLLDEDTRGPVTRVKHFLGLDDATPDAVQNAIGEFEFDDQQLKTTWNELLVRAGETGAQKAWSEVGADAITDWTDSTRFRELTSAGEDFAEDKLRRVTRDIRGSVGEAISEGEGMSGVRERMRESLDKTLQNEETIARSEAMRAYRTGREHALEDAGIQLAEWIAFPGACEVCQDLDGQVFQVGGAISLDDVDVDVSPSQAASLEDRGITEGAHPGCRCQTVAAESEVTGGAAS